MSIAAGAVFVNIGGSSYGVRQAGTLARYQFHGVTLPPQEETMTTKPERFPRLPERQWWALRDRFKQSIPAKVTPSYVATVFNMKEASAKANIIPALEAVGLISSDGTPTDLARRWRDDAEYPAVVKSIRESIYPDELLDAIPDPVQDRTATERWFANRTGHGEASAKKMAQLYELLSDGDPLRGQSRVDRPKRDKSTSASRTVRVRQVPIPDSVRESVIPSRDTAVQTANPVRTDPPRGPELHIDIQIHISSEASAEQIDQIFASMARHLYTRSE